MELAPITLGAGALGEREGVELAAAMLASSHRQIDTSNAYGGGRSETLLGAALAAREPDGARDALIVTKADRDPATGAFDGDRVRRSLEESLARLGLDHLPLLHLHDPYTITLAEAMAPDGAVTALVRLREEGVVDAIGIATGTRALVEEYVRTDAFDAVLTHNRYTLADRSAEPLLELAAARGMTVFNAAPFGGGILGGSRTRGESYGYRPIPGPLRAWLERLRALCAAHGVDPAAAALHFSLREPRIHSTVVGIPSRERLAALDRLVASAPPAAFWDDLAGLGAPPPSSND